MQIQPKAAPIHQMGIERPKARKKFSVLMEISNVLHIIATRLFGAGSTEVIILPASNATPVTAFTIPSATSPPPTLERIIAGNAALYTEAIKLMAAKNKIKSKIHLLFFRYISPALADCNIVSFLLFSS